MPASHLLAIQLKKDHDYMRELILSIDKEADRYDFIRLSNLVETHIRFEERELFQYLEQYLTAEELTAIHEQLEEHPFFCEEEWKDNFWVKKEAPAYPWRRRSRFS